MKLFRVTLCVVSAMMLMQSNVLSQTNLPKGDASTAALVDLCKNRDDLDGHNCR